MCNNFPNIKVVRGNAFALLMPLKKRTFESCEPIDEDIDATQLTDLVVKFGGVEYQASTSEDGVQIIIPADIAVGTYSIVLTAMYQGSAIRAAYESAVSIVDYNSQSDAQQYIAGSPIVLDAAYVIGGTLTDAELEALKEEYREKNAQLQQAIEDAEEAKREWEQKAADLDGVAQEATSQDILTAVENIDIDTSDLAKEATLGTPLVGQPSTIFAAIAAVGGGDDGKQTIADAINQMGGSATTNMTWAQLAYQIENNIYAFIDNAKFALLVPRPLNLIYLSASKLNGVEEIYDNSVISIPDDWMYGNLTIKKVTLSECTTAGKNTFRGCLQLNECSLEKLSACPQSLFDGCTSLYKVNIPNMISLSAYAFYNNAQLIDIITGAYIASNISLGYNPAQAYRTDISTLCFDTDLEEYGQLFSTNWDKWKWCIINHFAANLQDRSGLTAYTITFGSTVLSHFDAEMIAAFTDKNWTLA